MLIDNSKHVFFYSLNQRQIMHPNIKQYNYNYYEQNNKSIFKEIDFFSSDKVILDNPIVFNRSSIYQTETLYRLSLLFDFIRFYVPGYYYETKKYYDLGIPYRTSIYIQDHYMIVYPG